MSVSVEIHPQLLLKVQLNMYMFKQKGKVYKTLMRRVMLYGLELHCRRVTEVKKMLNLGVADY